MARNLGVDAGVEDSEVAAVANTISMAVANLESAQRTIEQSKNAALRGLQGEMARTLRQVLALQRTVNHIPGA